jgi:maltose/moltooligosaccharide transporter
MTGKRNLSFGQLFNLSFGFFGVQIAYALQSANISRIFATLGADPHDLSFFWILPPLMGMIVQPLVGKYSDKTWNFLGRRKPYLIVGALIAVAVMALLPNAGDFRFTANFFVGIYAILWFVVLVMVWLGLKMKNDTLTIISIALVALMLGLSKAGVFDFTQGLFLGLNAVMWFGLFSLMFLDTSINIAMQPFKMMVGDMVNEEQKGLAYSI